MLPLNPKNSSVVLTVLTMTMMLHCPSFQMRTLTIGIHCYSNFFLSYHYFSLLFSETDSPIIAGGITLKNKLKASTLDTEGDPCIKVHLNHVQDSIITPKVCNCVFLGDVSLSQFVQKSCLHNRCQ